MMELDPFASLRQASASLNSAVEIRNSEIERLYTEEGHRMPPIAEAAGLDRTTISRLLRNRGWCCFSRGAPPKERKTLKRVEDLEREEAI